MTRYDNMKFMGYDSEEEMDEAERRLKEIARKRINAEKESKPDKKNVGTKMTLDEAIKRYYKLAEEYTLDEFSFMEDKDSKKLAEEYKQVAKWLTELKEAKRLLKFAVEDFNEIKFYLSEPYSRLCDKWRYEDEVLKLIESGFHKHEIMTPEEQKL